MKKLCNYLIFFIACKLSSIAVAEGLERYVNSIEGDCAGSYIKVQRSPTNPDVYEILMRTGDSMDAVARGNSVSSKNCIIDWSFKIPNGQKFDMLEIKAFGEYNMPGRGFVRASIDHTVGHNHQVYDKIEYDRDWGDPQTMSWELKEDISWFQLPASMRGCGAEIKVDTEIKVKAQSYTDDSRANIEVRKIMADGLPHIRVCAIKVRPCNS